MNRKAFSHLFKMPVPRMEHFDHYLARLRMAPAYCHIPQQWAEWQAWEATLHDQDGGRAAVDWRARLIEALKALDVEALLSAGLPRGISIPKVDDRTLHHGETLISLDLVQANWTAIRGAVPDLAGLAWEEWTAAQGLPAILQQSKVLRQQVLGNVNPKAQQQRQALATTAIADALRGRGVSLVAHSADEIVICDSGDDRELIAVCQVLAPAGMYFQWGAAPRLWRLHAERYQLSRIPGGGFLKRRPAPPSFLSYMAAWTSEEQAQAKLQIPGRPASLFGVPGARFYLELCRALLEVPCQPEDLEFMHEGHPARWVLK